ncbi:MAG: prolyl aminopeptidase [Nanoarchaeota archaeon]
MANTKRNKPYMKGFLPVGQGHKLYFECCGNRSGPSVLYLHGGPGAGFDDDDKTYFDLKKLNVILFDQRGAGRSTPFASIKNNTTDHLITDINKLLDHLHIKHAFIFGGSWGSTLALIYTIRNPKRVTGLLLRGIYLATKKENKFYVGGGVAKFFPDEFEKFIENVPKGQEPQRYYLQMMRSKDRKTREKFAYAWTRYELSILKLQMTDQKIKKAMKKYNYISIGTLEAHYLSQGCFIPGGYILRHAGKIKVPVSIVQGRYDMICPPEAAWDLHKRISQSKLHLVFGGHSSSEPALKKKLVSEMKRMPYE